MRHLLDDLRHGARILTGSPGLCAISALLMALVICGSTTSYSTIRAILAGPAPGVDATGLVAFAVDNQISPLHRYGDYTAYAEQSQTLRALAITTVADHPAVPVSSANGTFLLRVTPVTGNYFQTIAVRPALGRAFSTADDHVGTALVAVISDRLWRTQFQQRDAAVGEAITIDGKPATIVGIAPPGFNGPFWGTGYPDIWVPLRAYERPNDDLLVAMIGRLRSGVSVAQARTEFTTIQARVHAGSPDAYRAVVAVPYAATAGTILATSKQQILSFISILTLLSLIVVCANVANLLLARALASERDTAVRQSVGASHARLLGLQIGEALALAAVTCTSALALTWVAVRVIPAMLPQGQIIANLPNDWAPDWRVAVYAALLTLAASALASLVPAARVWRQDPLPVLSAGSHTTIVGSRFIANALVVVQFGLSALLLTSASLAYRSWTLQGVDIGFDTRQQLLAVISTGAAARSASEHTALLARLRARFNGLPGVTSVTYTKGVPPFPWERNVVTASGSREGVDAQIEVVGASFLDTLGLTPLQGRALNSGDEHRVGRVAMINERLARTLWPSRSNGARLDSPAVGRSIRIGSDRGEIEVVGVVPDAFYLGFNIEVPDTHPDYVLLADQGPAGTGGREDAGAPGTMAWRLRFNGDLDSLLQAVPRALREVDPRIPISIAQTMASRLNDIASPIRVVTSLLFTFAGLSLLIAAIGQYAVVAFNMQRRTRDFGIRLTLGASGRHVLRSVLGEGARLTTIGLIGGCGTSIAAATLFRAYLFGIAPTDAATYIAVMSVLAGASILACYLPARRASRIDPVQALRAE